jgi:hypothetical protein
LGAFGGLADPVEATTADKDMAATNVVARTKRRLENNDAGRMNRCDTRVLLPSTDTPLSVGTSS